MQVVTPELIKNKRVLLRLDLDVPIIDGKVVEDFRLKAGLPTLKLCLENAEEVIVMGHIGRPKGIDPELSVEPIYDWLKKELREIGEVGVLGGKLKLLENLRFEEGEDKCDLDYAKELAKLGEVYVNEAFASYHESASTTVLPSLLPHFAGLRFMREVKELGEVRDNPKKPLVVVIGGAKVEDKLPVVLALSKIADAVLVGGKLPAEIKDQNIEVPSNVFVGKLNEEGTDLASETVDSWKNLIDTAQMIVWNGPVGKIEGNTWKESRSTFQVDDLGSAKGTYEIAQMIVSSKAESIIGGGDTVGFLGRLGMLGRFGFVSIGGGAMLKFLETGTLPTIEVLN